MKDVFSAPLKAAVIAGFTVGLLMLLINPPSLSGAAGLAFVAGGGLLLTLATAWIFASAIASGGMTEPEFERLVLRSEELARDPALRVGVDDFDLLVADAIDALPPEFQELLETTPVIVSQRGAEHRAYGHYIGDTVARDNFHDHIVLYQDTLERDFGYDPVLLRLQVERTLRHEVAHHLGWGERGVQELGL